LPRLQFAVAAGKFMEFVEALEVCRGLLRSGSAVSSRLALVILDNVVEVLMIHRCSDAFERDNFASHIISPEYSDKDRARVNADFGGKVWFLSSTLKLIPEEDAVVLRISHSFRNAGFHRDEHNDDANRVIVRLLLGVTCRVLTQVYGDGTISGGDESVVNWLKKYGIDAPYLDYGAASRAIGTQLREGFDVTTVELRQALAADLTRRLTVMQQGVAVAYLWPELVIDEILKSEAFDRQFDVEAGASGRYRQMLRLIGQGGQIPRALYRRRERERLRSIRSEYEMFAAPITWSEVQQLQSSVTRLDRQKSPGRVLAVYEELSDRLATAEHLLAAAIRKSEAAAEMAAEIAMGK